MLGTRGGRAELKVSRRTRWAQTLDCRETFEHIRVRLMHLGASDGTMTDFGTKLSVFFRDPDGLEAEVLWNKDPVALAAGSKKA